MNKILFLLFLPFLASAQKINESPIDIFMVIDEKIYEVKIYSEYQIIQDTFGLHSRIVAIDAAIDQLIKERQLLVDKIAFFESEKPAFIQRKAVLPKQKATKKRKKQ